jgi:hypothetical protein
LTWKGREWRQQLDTHFEHIVVAEARQGRTWLLQIILWQKFGRVQRRFVLIRLLLFTQLLLSLMYRKPERWLMLLCPQRSKWSLQRSRRRRGQRVDILVRLLSKDGRGATPLLAAAAAATVETAEAGSVDAPEAGGCSRRIVQRSNDCSERDEEDAPAAAEAAEPS